MISARDQVLTVTRIVAPSLLAGWRPFRLLITEAFAQACLTVEDLDIDMLVAISFMLLHALHDCIISWCSVEDEQLDTLGEDTDTAG